MGEEMTNKHEVYEFAGATVAGTMGLKDLLGRLLAIARTRLAMYEWRMTYTRD